MAIFALGPLRIELDGKPVQTSRHKALALLVYLAMLRDEKKRLGKQSREALSALFWSDYRQEKAFAYLRRTLWEANTILGEGWLEADRAEIGLFPQTDIILDVGEFQSHVNEFRQHVHPESHPCQECITHLHAAAMIYRGDFMTGFSLRDSPGFEDWQFFQREAIRREYAGALQGLASMLYAAGAFAESAVFSQRWLALDTLNEEAHRLLMKIYAVTSQRHLALRQYQECARIVQTELGAAPEPATSALYEEIVSGDIHPREDSSQNQATEPLSNLPTPATPFFGRQQLLEKIALRLTEPDCWLLTLLGPGGIGKSRLAIEAGQKQASGFPQGVHFVSLSMIENERSIVPAIARSVGLPFRQNGPAPEEQLLDYLREKRLLLILDSFEQLIQCAHLLIRIHVHAPGIKMLVTSRHRLLLQGEWVMEVPGLDYPHQSIVAENAIISEESLSFPAVELFLHAAQRNRASFQASQDDILSIFRITQMLEGIPLGLELAATWVNALSCQEIANEISRGLAILETSMGAILERQRSMRAIFDHSWRLLSRREQTLLPRLSVFRGSFSRQAAEQVAGISLRELSGLVDKSLVRRTTTGLYNLHDLLRQYCAEILNRSSSNHHQTLDRHCDFYSQRLSKWNDLLHGTKQGEALQEIEKDLENVQAAWDWAIGQKQLEKLAQAVDGLGEFYLRRARLSEGWDTFQKAGAIIQEILSDKGDTRIARLAARLITWQAALSMNLERFEEAEQLVKAGETILDDPKLNQEQTVPEQVFGEVIQGLLANLRFDPDATIHHYRQAIQLSQKAGIKSPNMFVFLWRFLMSGAVSRDLIMEIERNLCYVRQGGDPFETACYLYVLGISELYHTYQVEIAEPLLMESIENFQLVEDLSTQFIVYKARGYLLLVNGRFEAFHALKLQELAVAQHIGDCRLIGITHAEIGEVLYHLGNYPEAEEQIRKGMALVKEQSAVEYAHRHRYLGDVLLVQGKCTEAREAYLFSYHFYQTLNEKGWMMTALTGLSRAELALGNRPGAWQCARQALQLYSEIHIYTFFVYGTLADFALLLADQGDVLQALELFQLVSQQGYLARSRWFADLFGNFMDNAYAQLTADEQDVMKQNRGVLSFSEAIQKLLAC